MISGRGISGLTRWQIDAIGGAVCAALGLLWYLAGVQPLSEARASRVEMASQLQLRGEELKERNKSRIAHEEAAARLRSQLDSSRVQLHTVDLLNSRVAQLNRLATEHSLRVDEIRPGSPATSPRFTSVPIRLAGSGTFVQASGFLRDLRSRFPDMGVREFELRGEPEAADKTPTFAFMLVWYASPPAPASAPARK